MVIGDYGRQNLSREGNPLKESLHYKNYREFLELRRKISENDLQKLAEKYGINIEKLNEIRQEIRKRLLGQSYGEESSLGLVTTYHLLPWELIYYFLAASRIKKLGYHDYFSIPIFYGKSDNERPHQFNFGNFKVIFSSPDPKISLIFNIPTKDLTTFSFYSKLKSEFLRFFGQDENFNGDFRKLVEDYFNRENTEDDEKILSIINKLRNLKNKDNQSLLDYKNSSIFIYFERRRY